VAKVGRWAVGCLGPNKMNQKAPTFFVMIIITLILNMKALVT